MTTTFGGLIPGSGGGGGTSADITDDSAFGGPTVKASLNTADDLIGALDAAVGTLDTDVAAVEPTTTVSGSAAFTAGVWATVWTKTLTAGEAGTIRIANGTAWTGIASTVTNSQFRYYNAYRRQSAGGATVSAGAPGVQGNIAVSQIRLVASGNDIQLQLNFNVSATIFYRLPVYLETVLL